MNIGLVIHHFDPRRGGVEQWSWQFAKFATAAGHRVHVISASFDDACKDQGIVCHRVNCGGGVKFAEAAAERVGGLTLDVVHDTGVGWQCDVFQPHGGSRQASFEQNLLLLPPALRSWKRRLAPLLPRYRQLKAISARQCANDGRKIIAISKMVYADLQRYEQVPEEQLRLVYNGVDLARFRPANSGNDDRLAMRTRLGVTDEVVLLIVAHNFRLKGVPALLRAMKRLVNSQQRVHLVIAGGRRLAPWTRRVESAGLARHVTFLGSIADPVPWYHAADVYVQPTLYDPCSLVVLEALACGLPVVTSRFNGAGELITPGVQGEVLNNPQDDDALAASLMPLMDRRTRQNMSDAALAMIRHHPLERNCEEVLQVYQDARRTSAPANSRAA